MCVLLCLTVRGITVQIKKRKCDWKMEQDQNVQVNILNLHFYLYLYFIIELIVTIHI